MRTVMSMKKGIARSIVVILTFAMLLTTFTSFGWESYASSTLSIKSPALVVTGKGLIGNEGKYKADNVSLERSYSLEELKALGNDAVVSGQLYSAKKSQDPYAKNYFKVDGVKVSALLGKAESEIADDVRVVATDGYATQFLASGTYNNGKVKTVGINNPRYFYNLSSGQKGAQVPAVIGWADANTGLTDGSKPTDAQLDALSTTDTTDLGYLRLYCGQYDGTGGADEDMNQPLFNGKDKDHRVNKVQEGDEISEIALTIDNEKYTRAQVLLMDYAERTYQYSSSKGEMTDNVRGVPMSVLLKDYPDNAVVTFQSADGYDMSSFAPTVKELKDANYILAYEVNGAGIYVADKTDATKYGFFNLYGDGEKPKKMINKITVTSGTDFSTSPFKHITNGGITGQNGPYNVDSITGATLTVEGPGAKSSVALAVKDMESKNAGCYRGEFTDEREGKQVTRLYEGVDLHYILNNMQSGTNGIQLTDKANKVSIKNQNRETIASFTLDEVNKAHNDGKPIIVAYGTAYSESDTTVTKKGVESAKPFVFDYSTGGDEALGNYDGCLKLVYDTSQYGQSNNYKKFSNMAYIYVEEASEPGYKHSDTPYNSKDNTEYIFTLTGDQLGYEMNYTVSDLEKLVEYDESGKIKSDNKYGYRNEYSLANSTYWYVNEYEGIKLWSLMQRAGLDPSKATANATKNTNVSFKSTDNYGSFDSFTLAQVADDSQFSFYKKNAADPGDGSYTGDERIRQWDDTNKKWIGDKVASGYPILVAYGVNNYPYVKNTKLDGYLSGLQNDGGPLRVIWGKTNYSHANGSNQAKLVEKVIIGEDTYHYATHKYNDNQKYSALASETLNVKITTDGGNRVLKNENYKVGEIEDIIYDGKLSSSELQDAKIKAKYQGKQGYSDIYEGVNLTYFLNEKVGLSGTQGTIIFTSSDGSTKEYKLEDILNLSGTNRETGVSGLAPVLAYGKNGFPMVASKETDGYIDKLSLATGTDYENKYTVKNQGGPLEVLIPNADGTADGEYLANLTSIEISLETDKYAHTSEPYDQLADYELSVKGDGTRLSAEKKFKLSALESKQSLLVTADYSFKNSSGTVNQQRYRGINLFNFLKSTDVGLKSNAATVKITTTDNQVTEIPISDIQKTYSNTVTSTDKLPVMLAFGASTVDKTDLKDGKPLVASKNTEDGYDSAYGNDGGPLKLIIGQSDADDVNKTKCIKGVKSIEVIAGEETKWTHNQGVFKQYLNDTFKVLIKDKDGKEVYSKTYTVAELEDMDIIERVEMTTTGTAEYEGLVLNRFIDQECSAAGVESSNVNTVNVIKDRESEKYSVDILGKVGRDQLVNGIKDGETRVPILLAYAVNGYPLAFGDKKDPNGEGYDSTVGNNCGPIRLMVHNSQGACISEVNTLELILGTEAPVQSADFTLESNTLDEPVCYSVAQLKKLAKAGVEKQYNTKDGAETVRGMYLKDLLELNGITDSDAKITVSAGGYDGSGTYVDITLEDASNQNYLIAYELKNGDNWEAINDTQKTPNSKVRIYREYLENHPEADQTKWYNKCQYITGVSVVATPKLKFTEYVGSGEAGDLPIAGLRSTTMNAQGDMFVGTYGGGLSVKQSGSDSFKTYNMSSNPALITGNVSAVAADFDGGVWFSQNASYTDPDSNAGLIYLKNGKLTNYRAGSGTIPNDYVQAIKVAKDGCVWIGSFGGLTMYNPRTKVWKTWDKLGQNGATAVDFPAESVSTIEVDDEGGVWLGFYPDSEDPTGGSKAFTGGYAYFKNGKVVKSYTYTSAKDRKTGSYRLGDVWVRDIALDSEGNAWIVASGSYKGMDNCGGKVWFVKAGGGKAKSYNGYDLVGKSSLSSADNSELRAVAVDPDGGLWFGSSADGILYAQDSEVADGKLSISAQYCKANGSWNQTNMDNVFSLDVYGKTLYSGTAAGLATHTFDFVSSNKIPSEPEISTDEKLDEQIEEIKKIKDAVLIQNTSVSGWTVANSCNSLSLYISYNANVDGYVVNGQTTNATSITYNNLICGHTYSFAVKGYKVIDGERIYTREATITGVPAPKSPVITSAKAGKRKATLKWTKVSEASGYTVYRSKNRNAGYKAVKTTKKNNVRKFTNYKLKKKTTYYYCVVSYKKVNGKKIYGTSANIVAVTAK